MSFFAQDTATPVEHLTVQEALGQFRATLKRTGGVYVVTIPKSHGYKGVEDTYQGGNLLDLVAHIHHTIATRAAFTAAQEAA